MIDQNRVTFLKANSDDWEDIGVLDWIMLCRAITKISIIYEEPYAYSVFSGVK